MSDATTETKPTPKPKRKSAKRKSAASSRPGSGRKSNRGKRSGAMAKQGRYVLVIHMPKAMQAKLDKARKNVSRSEFCRTIVAKRLGFSTKPAV